MEKKGQLSKTLVMLFRPKTPEPISVFAVKSCFPRQAHVRATFKCHWSRQHDYSEVCVRAIYKITSSMILWCSVRMMYYEVAQSIRDVLTWNDLKHAVLLHVGGKVPSSHVLLHYANIGQLLTGRKHGLRRHSQKVHCYWPMMLGWSRSLMEHVRTWKLKQNEMAAGDDSVQGRVRKSLQQK